jgi:hypothetical protein
MLGGRLLLLFFLAIIIILITLLIFKEYRLFPLQTRASEHEGD